VFQLPAPEAKTRCAAALTLGAATNNARESGLAEMALLARWYRIITSYPGGMRRFHLRAHAQRGDLLVCRAIL
jgi:hypothetical protein